MMPREYYILHFYGSDGTCVFSTVDNLITSDNHFVHFLGIFFHDDSQILALVRDGYGFHPDKRNDQYDVGVFGLYHFELSVQSVATPMLVPLIRRLRRVGELSFYP